MYNTYKDMTDEQLKTFVIQLERQKGMQGNLEQLLKDTSREMLISRILYLNRLEDEDE